MYDFVLEKSLFELWEHMDFVYALRKGLDEGDKTSINEAVHCLSNIMYPWEEEASFFLISFNAYIECDGMALVGTCYGVGTTKVIYSTIVLFGLCALMGVFQAISLDFNKISKSCRLLGSWRR